MKKPTDIAQMGLAVAEFVLTASKNGPASRHDNSHSLKTGSQPQLEYNMF